MAVIRCDIDGTLCTQDGINYLNAKPNQVMIDYINERYKNGDHIILWTSRGRGRDIDLSEMTIKQLFDWDVNYHVLKMDKPYFDLMIDDKCKNPKCIEKQIIDESVQDYNI